MVYLVPVSELIFSCNFMRDGGPCFVIVIDFLEFDLLKV